MNHDIHTRLAPTTPEKLCNIEQELELESLVAYVQDQMSIWTQMSLKKVHIDARARMKSSSIDATCDHMIEHVLCDKEYRKQMYAELTKAQRQNKESIDDLMKLGHTIWIIRELCASVWNAIKGIHDSASAIETLRHLHKQRLSLQYTDTLLRMSDIYSNMQQLEDFDT